MVSRNPRQSDEMVQIKAEEEHEISHENSMEFETIANSYRLPIAKVPYIPYNIKYTLFHLNFLEDF